MPFTRSDQVAPLAGTVVKLSGTVDRATADSLNATMRDIAQAATPEVIIDIADVDEVNGALLGVLVRTTRWVGWRNGRTVIVCPRADLRRGLEIAGLDHLAEVHSSWPELNRSRPGTPAQP
jgi:anti-anti-sigma factor